MDLKFNAKDLAHRDEFRAFINEHFPVAIRNKPSDLDIKHWHQAVYQRGWAAINWPVEYGGTGWTETQQYFWDKETASAGCPQLNPFGINMLAPVLIRWGSEEQKQEHLPKILSGERQWCQGYSEPGADSDLALLSTDMARENENYIVNAAKAWITGAQPADWMFCLMRTDDPGRKQESINFLLIDMSTPGITVNPVTSMADHYSVTSATFINVKVPVSNRVGDENNGWTYAKEFLNHERISFAGVARSKAALERLKTICAEQQSSHGTALLEDSIFMTKLSDIEIQLMALEMTELRALAVLATGKAPGPENSLLNIKGTEITQRLAELALEASAYYAIPYADVSEGSNEPPIGPDYAREGTLNYLTQRFAKLYGGSSEVQKNIIAKAELGL